MKFKLGKHKPRFDERTLQFGAYLKATLPAPPHAVDYSKAVHAWPMYGNDEYGDCTCAAAGHMIQEWTANAGAERTPAEPAILKAYDHFSKGNADAGANMLDVLKYWRKQGIADDHIGAFTALEPQNRTQAMDSIDLFGTCYLGVALPDFAVDSSKDILKIPWVVPPGGAKGKAAPNPENGHCICAVGYDQRSVYVVTWGAVKAMSWQFYETYADEAYAVLSNDWVNGKGISPPGFDLAQLKKDLAALG